MPFKRVNKNWSFAEFVSGAKSANGRPVKTKPAEMPQGGIFRAAMASRYRYRTK